MEIDSRYLFNVVSTFSIIIPLVFCLRAVQKRADRLIWLFFVFLLLGFAVDFLGWLSYLLDSEGFLNTLTQALYEPYPALEAMFFFWLILTFSMNQLVKRISKIGLYSSIPVWLTFEFLLSNMDGSWIENLGIFHSLYRILIAFFAAFTLLQMIEVNSELRSKPTFWFLLGLLLYNFTTFVILLIRKMPIAEDLWYLHNTANILTYGFFSVGLYLAKEKTVP